MTVPVDGDYILKSSSSIDTFALLYVDNFYPNSSSVNYFLYDDDSGGDYQFQINVYLQSNRRYLLVVTTFSSFTNGNYTLLASGLNRVNLHQINSSVTIPTTIATTSKFTLFISSYNNYIKHTIVYARKLSL
jgi:hypothetical protein